MSNEADMRERHARVLADLAQAGMHMVERLTAAMAAADDTAAFAQVALAFHRVSRAVRLTIALEFRLAQETLQPKAKPAPREAAPPEPPCERGDRLDSYDYEREPREDLDELREIDDLLAAGDLAAVNAAIGDCVAKIRRELEVDPALVAPRAASPRPARPASRVPHLLAAQATPQPARRSGLLAGTAALKLIDTS